jgi:curli biogenesis system outer membrane secretion channel CsgG
MRRRTFGRFAASALAVAALSLPSTALAQGKNARPQIAVLDFDYGTLDNWWGQYDIGKGVADQLVDALVEDGSFRVIERKRLATLLSEQDFAQSDRADPSAAKMAKIGKVLGIKYLLVGSITKFSTEKRGGGVRIKGIGLGGGKAKSEVRLTGRVIDVTTGEILISGKGAGESSKGGGFDFSKGGFGVGTNSDEWRNSGLGDAQEMATVELIKTITAKMDRLQ